MLKKTIINFPIWQLRRLFNDDKMTKDPDIFDEFSATFDYQCIAIFVIN